MAGNYTIDVNVALRTQQANIKNLRKQIETEFSEIDFNSSVGKELNKLFGQFDKKISNMDSILSKGVLNTNDLNRLGNLFDSMNMIVGQMHSATGKAPLFDLGIDPKQFPELVAAMEQVKKVQNEMLTERNKSSKEALKLMNKEETLDKLNNLKGTKASQEKSLQRNAAILEAEHKQRVEAEKRIQQELDSLTEKRKSKEQERDREQEMSIKASEAAQRKEVEVKEKQALSKNSVAKMTNQQNKAFSQQKQSIQNFLKDVYSESAIAMENHFKEGSLSSTLIKSLFSEAEMDDLAGKSAEDFRRAFEEKLFSNNGQSANQQNIQTFGNTIQRWLNANPESISQATANASALRQQIGIHARNSQAADLEVSNTGIEIEQKTEELVNLQVQISNFASVVEEMRAAAEAFRASIDEKYKPQMDDARRNYGNARDKLNNQQYPSSQPGNQAFSRNGVDEDLSSINAQKEADSFTQKMKDGIKQWLGVREIIGHIKQGIRSAYQDIQSLDKAMTNIAVVTDMSTSDLWGRINEYMGMAQQYGVTTQGVYEVSQLYFQQGLGEADVMAATTETLKMARIAGMDYAEAADGMTVAIRGFNMEMSEASRVTDVYSKVAAVTASDTQELVTAMSKTASSAAAVGSSFENTTAMLAVMIEATRESPQNLGSALKSIISRYGEMTKGLSEDSEGEEIDYNRVDAALKTVGISIKDAQGQFRDFDTVIEELSAKWDTLDSVTQRYIATIFAGNRQQSRFLALVSNYDRYMEVSEAAANSEDAGLLQYSKTLESLESKLNNIKTGFQQFYMDIFNGPVIGKFLDFLNKVITGLNKLGNFQAVLNIGSMISGIKALVSLLIQPFGQISSVIAKAIEEGFKKGRDAAREGAREIVSGTSEGASGGRLQRFGNYVSDFNSRYGTAIRVGEIAGGALSALGTWAGAENARWGTAISGIGNTASYAAMGAQVGGIYGAVIGGLAGIITTIASWPSDLEMAQQELEKATEKAQEANIERAKAKERSTGLEETIEKLQELKKHQYDSAEAQEEFIKANNEAFEKFPDLAVTFDEFGNAFINIQSAEEALTAAREATATATLNATRAELDRLRQERDTNKLAQVEHLGQLTSRYSDGWSNLDVGDNFTNRIVTGGEGILAVQNYRTTTGSEPYWEVMDERIRIAQEAATEQYIAELGYTPETWRERNELNNRLSQAEADTRQNEINVQDAQRAYYDSIFNSALSTYLSDDLGGQETVDFVSDLLGNRLVTEYEASQHRGEGAKANTFTTMSFDEQGNAVRTYEKIADASLEFILRGADSLNLTDQGTRDFLVSLSNMSDETEAVNAILTNFSQLQYKEGINPTRFLGSYFGYNLDNPEEQADFFEMLGNNATFNSKEAGYNYAIDSTRNSQVASNVNNLINEDEELKESINNVSGLREFAQKKAIELTEGLGDEALLDMAETSGLISETLSWASDFSQQAEALNVDEELSGLFESAKAGKISKNNLTTQIEALGFNVERDALLQEYINSFYEDLEQTKNNIITSLHESPTTWTTHVTQRDVFGEVDVDNLLNEIAPNYWSAITDFKNYLAEKIDSGGMSDQQANQTAREFISAWEATTNLPVEQIAQAQLLLSEADLTTTLGKEDLKSKLEEAGITDEALFGEIDGIYPYAENLVTQYGQLEEKLFTGLESMSNALSGASEGINISEAVKIADKVGKDLLDLFNFQDGQYIAKDTNALREIQEAYATEEKAALNESYENQIRILQEEGTTETIWDYDEDGFYAPVTPGSFIAPSEEYTHLMEQYGEAANAWYQDLIQNDQLELEGLTGGETSSQIVQAYLTDLKEDTEKAIDQQTEYLVEQAQQALEINNRTFELEGGVQGRNKREAFDLLASNGLTGYSAEQIAQLETYLGIGADGLRANETGIGTGEYRITRGMLESLNLPGWVQDSINARIEEQVQSTKSGLEDLMSSIASGEELTDTQIKSLLGQEFEGISDTIARGYQGAMQVALETGNFGHLENILKAIYESKGAENADKLAKESIARFQDQIKEYQKEIIDLSISALEGDISVEDALKLGTQGIDVNGLINRTQEAINTLIQSIVDNTDISFSDKKSKLESVYNAGLESILGYETSIVGSLTSREGMSRSDASSLMAELTALGVKTKGRFEESADGTKFYLNNVTDIMSDLTRTIENESTNPQQRAAAESLLKQVRYVQEWQPYELADSLGSTIEEMANATEVSTIEMRDFYKELTGRDISIDDAQRLARELNELDPVARIERLVAIARQSGIEVEGMEERLAEVAANVLDTIIEAISSGMSVIGEGLSGSLSFSGLNELMQKYNLQIQDSFGTASGATLGEQDRRSLIAAMYKEAKASGLQVDFGDQLWETFRDSDNNPYAGYNALEEELDVARSRVAEAVAQDFQAQQELILAQARRSELVRLGGRGEELAAVTEVVAATQEMANNTAQAAEEAQAYAEALEQARAAAMFDENAYEFTFMEQDATSGLTKNADNFINQIEAVKTAFQSFENEESIGYQDFYNMMDFIKNTGQWESFSQSFSQEMQDAGISYENFVNSVVANTDEWGKVDIGGVAAQMGISVDAAMTAMSDSMKSGLIEVAKQQVDYLTGLESMLKAMAALESIGDIGLGLNITIDGETQTAEEWINSWESLDEETRKQFIIELKANLNDNIFDDTGIDQDMRHVLDGLFGEGFSNTLNSQIFNEDGEVINTEIAGQYMQLISSISKSSQEQSGELAQGMAHVMQNVQGIYMESLGYALGEDGLWKDAEGQVAQLTADQQFYLLDALNKAAKNAKPMDIASFSENYLQALNAGDTRANISGGRIIELNWDGTTTITDANGNPLTPEAVRALDAEAIAQMEADLNQNRADTEHYYDLIIDAQGHLTYNIIPIGDVNAVLENSPDMLTINEEEIDVIVNTNTQSITFVDSHGRTLTGDALQQAMDAYTSQMNLGDRGVGLNIDENGVITLVPTITPAPSNTEILTQIASDIQAIKDSLLEGFDVTLNDQATSVLGAIQSAYDELRAYFEANPIIATVTQVGGISLPNTPTDSPTTQTPSGAGPFAGTMNGLAFADGSLGRLHSGAVLANKALVGELGPELAVYDGQYHMLGANGAEFVDLPSDAIIFNHLQTQGILKGQMNIRGTAMAEGNVTGPAFAGGGIGAALAAVRRAKSVWQGLLSSLTAADLLGNGGGGGGGGGGDESLKAHIADLQEWYNLSRQIADIEGQINVLLAKRKNITDGHEYLRNLRETQRLLDDQVNTQQDLLRFQQLQLQRQAEHINTNKIWSQFLEVDENGLLQYKKGNETNGGKGALEVLQQMNEMSGEEQLAFIQSLGWSYTNTDGEELENEELVAKFYEELQKQIDDYDALRDTVQEAESALEDLEAEIAEIEREIRDNEIDLSQEIYDIIVDAWKENIENLKEQNDLIKEANEAYANGIQEAIDAERQMYEQNTAIQDREQLQRQLALMRRSGGSASEIADLEKQLDGMFKDEYFSNQEDALENIREANENQAKLLDQQVKIQEELLEYQQENGVIWQKVYEVMSGTDAEIIDFMMGNSTSFFEQSALQQEDMLTEWAKKIGIYTEERQRQNYAAEAAKTFSSAWETEQGKDLKAGFDKADAKQQEKWKREYNDTYASKRLEGKTHEEALALAQQELYEHIQNWLKAEEQNSSNGSSNNSSNNSSDSNTEQHGTRTVWQAYGRKNSEGQRRWGPRNTNSREGARQGFKSQYGFWPEGVDERIEEYAKGGIINKTGLVWVDGSKSKPERILSAEQNRILEEGLAMASGRGETLKDAFNSFASNLGASIRSSIANIINNTTENRGINIESGAIVLQVQQLNDQYDIDELYNDITNKVYSIAARASGRGVNRR